MKIKNILGDISKSLATIAESLYIIASYIVNNNRSTREHINIDINRKNPEDFVSASSIKERGDRK